MTARRILIVAGPTCSGKSALAMALAERLGGTVINADAMQTYRELRVLTARPTPADERRVPHALYGIRLAATPCSVAWWRTQALEAIASSPGVPILCGGSGMYMHALLHGLAAVPAIAEPVREEARWLLASLGAAGLHARLAERDPVTAASLRPSDGQRVARAWEVVCGTGLGLAAWQQQGVAAPTPVEPWAITLAPPRPELLLSIARRWTEMIADDALGEVRALRVAAPDPSLPARRAHGVPELCDHLDGKLTLDQVGQCAVAAIGRYTRRQATWLRHHTLAAPEAFFTIDARFSYMTQLTGENIAAMIRFLSHRS